MNKKIIVVASLIIVILILIFLTNSNDEIDNNINDSIDNTEITENTDLNETDNTEEINETDENASPGSFENYSPEKLALAENGDVVLFFHATWCPSCRFLSSDIENNLSQIPSNLTILKLDYDSETELKRKYGVTTQHTLVQVDKNGDMIKKWSGGANLGSIISQIQ